MLDWNQGSLVACHQHRRDRSGGSSCVPPAEREAAKAGSIRRLSTSIYGWKRAAKLAADCYPCATQRPFSDLVDCYKLLILLVELAGIEPATS